MDHSSAETFKIALLKNKNNNTIGRNLNYPSRVFFYLVASSSVQRGLDRPRKQQNQRGLPKPRERWTRTQTGGYWRSKPKRNDVHRPRSRKKTARMPRRGLSSRARPPTVTKWTVTRRHTSQTTRVCPIWNRKCLATTAKVVIIPFK